MEGALLRMKMHKMIRNASFLQATTSDVSRVRSLLERR